MDCFQKQLGTLEKEIHLSALYISIRNSALTIVGSCLLALSLANFKQSAGESLETVTDNFEKSEGRQWDK